MCVAKKKAWLRQFRRRLLSVERRRQRVDDVAVGAFHDGRLPRKTPMTAPARRLVADAQDKMYNEELLTGLGQAGAAAVTRGVWGVEDLSEVEMRFIARRLGDAPLLTVAAKLPRRESPQRQVIATRDILRHEVLLREATPLFAPSQRRCTGCDAPLSAPVACGSCGAAYCSATCRSSHAQAHQLECWMGATGTTAALRQAYRQGKYAQHTALHLPIQASWLAQPSRRGWADLERVIYLLCRSLSLVQTVEGKLVPPTQVPLLSMLPYRPVPPLLGVPRGGTGVAPPLEMSLLYHMARGLAEVTRMDFDAVWGGFLEELWHVWEVVCYNAPRTGTSLHPVTSLLPHSCTPNASLHRPTNQLVYLVASRDIRAGEELSLDYLKHAYCRTHDERAALLRRAWHLEAA
eukprot:TRINITY_DN7119_c0_g1_i1.p1 TRINITY_DN7119_c0_g1~~TRINITY_DN7119_c0_g1_i1.p1  ORF type:complete len:405 (+),score=54.15 TRINITY_DN7119_c0_g1_i1:1121-2335(+)